MASGPRLARGPSSPGPSTHQPALRWVPCSRTKTAGPLSNTRRTTEPRGLVALGGASMSRRPAWERWIRSRRPPSSSMTRNLPRRHHVIEPTADQLAGVGQHGLQGGETELGWPSRWAPLRAASRRSARACISGSSGMAAPWGRRWRPGGRPLDPTDRGPEERPPDSRRLLGGGGRGLGRDRCGGGRRGGGGHRDGVGDQLHPGVAGLERERLALAVLEHGGRGRGGPLPGAGELLAVAEEVHGARWCRSAGPAPRGRLRRSRARARR